jgi:pimeloyl-ACP methyl ester carboxylesterase
MSGGLASFYAANYPSRGLVSIDNSPDISHSRSSSNSSSTLRGPGFTQVWQSFEDSLDSNASLSPALARARNPRGETGRCRRLLADRAPHRPDEFQALIDAQIRQLDAIPRRLRRAITPSERERFGWMPDAQLEEWVGDGHFVHLVEPDRFATRLRQFVDHCTATS